MLLEQVAEALVAEGKLSLRPRQLAGTFVAAPMTIRPSDYYDDNADVVATTLSEVKAFIDAIEQHARSRRWRVFWRGQASHEWGLLSSLARGLSVDGSVVDDSLIDRVEERLLKEASGWIAELGDAAYGQPLAKLAYLQHHGIPTRLIDFTENPWMSVFFAAESNDGVDGRIFALMVEDGDIISTTPDGTPWRKYGTNVVKIYDATAAGVIFPRLKAQAGVLALGRLPSTQPHRKALDSYLGRSRSLLAEEVRRILSIPFKLVPFTPAATTSVPAGATLPIGLTFRVHVDKESVRRDLAGGVAGRRSSPSNLGATHQSVYPDAAGMVAYSTTIKGLRKGVLVV